MTDPLMDRVLVRAEVGIVLGNRRFMSSPSNLAKVRLHNKLRLLGIPLFLGGITGLVTSTALVVQDQATWHLILWCFGATLTGLATFGNHNDNAIAWMLLCDPGELSAKNRSELQDELAHDRTAVQASKPTPKLAAFITCFALLLQTVAGYKLFQVLG